MALVRADQTPSNPVKSPSADVPSEVLRDRWKRPLIVTPEGEVTAYTRASSIGGVLEDQTGLGYWKMRQAMWAVAHSRPLRLRIAAIPDTTSSENKEKLRKAGFDALDYADSHAAADVGTALHSLTERVDLGQPIPDIGEDQAAIDAYVQATRGKFRFHGTEQFVVCDRFKVAGTFDRIVEPLGDMTVTDENGEPVLHPDGSPVVIVAGTGQRLVWDLKTSGSSDYFGIKFAAQLAAYAHGVRYRPWNTLDPDVDPRALSERERMAATRGERLSWPDGIAPRTDYALILHVPQGGPAKPGDPAAQLYWVDLTLGLELLELAVQIQRWRSYKGLVVPAEPPRVPLAPALANGGLMSLIDAVEPPTKQAFNELWAQHKSAWTPAHKARAQERLEAAAGERVAS